VPFPGTLNLRLLKGSSRIRDMLNKIPAIQISGFCDGQRTFGRGKCYPAKVKDIDAAIVIPERTHYPEDLIEIIAPVRLRDALDLKDGDKVLITIATDSIEVQ
jgi:riboflavin kinase